METIFIIGLKTKVYSINFEKGKLKVRILLECINILTLKAITVVFRLGTYYITTVIFKNSTIRELKFLLLIRSCRLRT